MSNQVTPGIYKHYKGALYKVLSAVQHSETEEWFVSYQALYGDYGYWVRPLAMFNESILVGGVQKPRFELLKAD